MAGLRFPERKRIIGSERYTLGAEELQQHLQRAEIMHERVDVKTRRLLAIRQVAARIVFVIDRNQVRPDVKCMLDSTDRERECAATVRKGDAQFGETFEHATEHHRANGE